MKKRLNIWMTKRKKKLKDDLNSLNSKLIGIIHKIANYKDFTDYDTNIIIMYEFINEKKTVFAYLNKIFI